MALVNFWCWGILIRGARASAFKVGVGGFFFFLHNFLSSISFLSPLSLSLGDDLI